MKVLNVNKLEFNTPFPDLNEISEKLDKTQKRNFIDEINWKGFDYKPEVSFATGYTDDEIFIKYYISEDYFKAEMTKTNQMVCEDSCVEFFVSPANDGIYYNFEFNGIETCLMGSGTNRENNIHVDPLIISKIRRSTSIGKNPIAEVKGRFSWTIKQYSCGSLNNFKNQTKYINRQKPNCRSKRSFLLDHYNRYSSGGLLLSQY